MTDTLKSICEQCSQLNTPQLDFIPPELLRHREIIRRDLRELVIAASHELDRAVVFLAGSLAESILLSFLAGQKSYIEVISGSVFVFPPKMSLQNCKEVFNAYFGRAIPGSKLPDLIVEYRDTIHINKELALPEDIYNQASRDLLRILDKLLADLTGFAAPAIE
jgi:hypothetical protein